MVSVSRLSADGGVSPAKAGSQKMAAGVTRRWSAALPDSGQATARRAGVP